MNSGYKWLTVEFALAVGFISWKAIRSKRWPWPGYISQSAIAFTILIMIGAASEELAALLGAGFLLTAFIKLPWTNNGHIVFGPHDKGVPSGDASFPYNTLSFGEPYTQHKVGDSTFTPSGGSAPASLPNGSSTTPSPRETPL